MNLLVALIGAVSVAVSLGEMLFCKYNPSVRDNFNTAAQYIENIIITISTGRHHAKRENYNKCYCI